MRCRGRLAPCLRPPRCPRWGLPTIGHLAPIASPKAPHAPHVVWKNLGRASRGAARRRARSYFSVHDHWRARQLSAGSRLPRIVSTCWTAIAVFMLSAWPGVPPVAAPRTEPAVAQSQAARRGLSFAKRNCARCHAVEKAGESPLAAAPPFRTMDIKYAVEDLQRPLAQGIHSTMPVIRLEASQVADLMAYLKTLKP
jgi:cytochrome c